MLPVLSEKFWHCGEVATDWKKGKHPPAAQWRRDVPTSRGTAGGFLWSAENTVLEPDWLWSQPFVQNSLCAPLKSR